MGVEIGQVIDGKYRVASVIGEGGMGAVFGGEHLRLHRKVAIKVLHAAMARDAEVVRRFEREAQAAGKIGNDHILEVLDIGELPDGERFIVMEFLEGEPLNTRLERLQRMTPQQTYPVVRQLLEGLAAAHAAGIVHRDLKPANVFIQREKAGRPDYVKIIDFGISKFQNVGGDEAKTRTGMIIGTPLYMSPEQARGLSEADARADLYAVGVILYESVTGRVPFTGASPTDLLFQIALSTPPPIASIVGDVDPAFCSIVERAMARDPNARFQSGAEFIAALDAWANAGQGVAAPGPRTMPVGLPYGMAPPVSSLASTPGPGPGTPWASSQSLPQPPAPARNPGAIVAVLALAVVAVLGLGGLALAIKARSNASAASAAASASAVATAPAPTASVAPAPVPSAPPAEVVTLAPQPSAPPAPETSATRPATVARPATPPPAHRPPPSAPPAAATATGYNPFGHL
ncbi:MAG TPA: serine/threonine-protein kinase [Polyangiaceae bacterium]